MIHYSVAECLKICTHTSIDIMPSAAHTQPCPGNDKSAPIN